MPTEIRCFQTARRSLWLSRTPRGLSIQVQDGEWFSDRFPIGAVQLEAITTGMVAAIELGAIEDEAALRLRWSESMLIVEYESEGRGWREELDVAGLVEALSEES